MKRDMRQYSRQTTYRLVIGGIILLFVVGGGLIFLIYGPAAMASGILCLGAALLPILLIFLALSILEWIVKRANRD